MLAADDNVQYNLIAVNLWRAHMREKFSQPGSRGREVP